jgi:hypothetical protein
MREEFRKSSEFVLLRVLARFLAPLLITMCLPFLTSCKSRNHNEGRKADLLSGQQSQNRVGRASDAVIGNPNLLKLDLSALALPEHEDALKDVYYGLAGPKWARDGTVGIDFETFKLRFRKNPRQAVAEF